MKNWIGVLAVFAAVLFAPFVVALGDGADVATQTGSGTGQDSPDADADGTRSINAGNIYHYDLDAESMTNYWAGVWGNVSGKVELRDSSNNIFMSKAITSGDPVGNGAQVLSLVFAYNVADTVPSFAGIQAAPRAGSGIDTITGVNTVLTDSASSLFTNAGYNSFHVGNVTINNAVANSAWGSNVYNSVSGALISSSGLYQTMVLNDGTSNLLFVTEARDPYADQRKVFDNSTFANYQMLLYVNNSGNANAQSYEFFLELR